MYVGIYIYIYIYIANKVPANYKLGVIYIYILRHIFFSRAKKNRTLFVVSIS